MSYIRTSLALLFIILFFSSCNALSGNIGWTGLIVLGIILMALFIFMFYLIIKRRRQGDKSLAQFSASIQTMLSKFDKPENKIGALERLIERINEDDTYKKDTNWRNQVLAKTYLHLATQYHNIGDMKNTLKTCSKILELTPDDAMTLYNRGSIYLNNGEYAKALTDLNKSIELVNDYGSSYNNRGTALSKLGRNEEAILDFNKALELEETSIIHYNRANTLKDLKRNEEAIVSYQKSLELCDEDEEALRKEITSAIESLKGKE